MGRVSSSKLGKMRGVLPMRRPCLFRNRRRGRGRTTGVISQVRACLLSSVEKVSVIRGSSNRVDLFFPPSYRVNGQLYFCVLRQPYQKADLCDRVRGTIWLPLLNILLRPGKNSFDDSLDVGWFVGCDRRDGEVETTNLPIQAANVIFQGGLEVIHSRPEGDRPVIKKKTRN